MKEKCFEVAESILRASRMADRGYMAAGIPDWHEASYLFRIARHEVEDLGKRKIISKEEADRLSLTCKRAEDLCNRNLAELAYALLLKDLDIVTTPTKELDRLAIDKACRCEK